MDYIKKYMCCIHDSQYVENVTKDITAELSIEQSKGQTVEHTENDIKQIQIVPKQHIEIEMKTIKSPTNSNYATNSNYDFNEEFNEVTNEDYNDIPPEKYNNVKSPTNEIKNNLFVSSLSIKNYFKQTK
jgi:hypothetical protein